MMRTLFTTPVATALLCGSGAAAAHSGDHGAVAWYHALVSADHLLVMALPALALAGLLARRGRRGSMAPSPVVKKPSGKRAGGR